MKHFTIDAENNITVHASRKEARETDAGVFATEEQFADLIGPDNKRLIEIWNSLPGVRPVTKFTSRKTATERIWKAIQNLGEATPPAAAESITMPEKTEPVEAQTPDVATAEVAEPFEPHTPDVATVEARLDNAASPASEAATAAKTPKTREGSKTSRVIELLKREGGVTLKELMIEMGWQSHTTRALLSAGGTLAKKHGLTVISTKAENGDRRYELKA